MQGDIEIPLSAANLKGNLSIPPEARGMVVFVHGSGSSRLSPRNIQVAEYLQQRKFGTLLFDLLSEREDLDYSRRFDIALLTERLVKVTAWLNKQETAAGLAVGYFGASTGGAAAISAAAVLPDIKAVVSRGGRPDLAGDSLPFIKAATLLIVGGEDHDVLALNRQAFKQMNTTKELRIIPGATHLFEEPGKMDEVMQMAYEWFEDYL